MTSPQHAESFLDWHGTTMANDPLVPDEQKSPFEIFQHLEISSESSLSVVSDEERGKVWLFDKPSSTTDYRCETNGVISRGGGYTNWAEGHVYDISWSSRLEAVASEHGPFVIFQWKSKAGGSQNYPFLFTVKHGRLVLVHSTEQGAWQEPWAHSIQANTWFDVRVRVALSKDASQGWIALWLNNVPQVFADSQETLRCRTLDTNGVYPKWGFYKRDFPQMAMKHWVDRLAIKRIR